MKKPILYLIGGLLASFAVSAQQFEDTITGREGDEGVQQIQDKSDVSIYGLIAQNLEVLNQNIAVAEAAIISSKVDIAINKAVIKIKQTRNLTDKDEDDKMVDAVRKLAEKILQDKSNNYSDKPGPIRKSQDFGR